MSATRRTPLVLIVVDFATLHDLLVEVGREDREADELSIEELWFGPQPPFRGAAADRHRPPPS